MGLRFGFGVVWAAVVLSSCQSAVVASSASKSEPAKTEKSWVRDGKASRRIPFNSQIFSNSTVGLSPAEYLAAGSVCGWTAPVDFDQIQIATSMSVTSVGNGETSPAFNGNEAKPTSKYYAGIEVSGENRGAFLWDGKPTLLYTTNLVWSNKRPFKVGKGDEISIRSAVIKTDGHPAGALVGLRPLHRLASRYGQQGGNDIFDASVLSQFERESGATLGENNRETPFVFGFTKSPIRVALVSGDSIGYGGNGYGKSSIERNGATSYIEIALWQDGSDPLIWMNVAEPASSLFNRYPSKALAAVSAAKLNLNGYKIRSQFELAVDFTDEFCSFGTNEFAHAASGFDRAAYLDAVEEMFAQKIRKNNARKRRTYLCLDPVAVEQPMPSPSLSDQEYLDAQKPYLNSIVGEGGVTQLRRDLIKRLSALCQKLGNAYVIDATSEVQALNSRGELVWRKSMAAVTKGAPRGDGTHPNEAACNVMATNIRSAIGGAFSTKFRSAGLLVGNPDL